jgi:hypothetical protein
MIPVLHIQFWQENGVMGKREIQFARRFLFGRLGVLGLFGWVLLLRVCDDMIHDGTKVHVCDSYLAFSSSFRVFPYIRWMLMF